MFTQIHPRLISLRVIEELGWRAMDGAESTFRLGAWERAWLATRALAVREPTV